MISHKHRCIFVHIPRTGGSSVENLIWGRDRSEADLWMGFISEYHNKYQTGGLQHLRAIQIRQEVGPEVFQEYFKFSFVRNPWDKAVSQYMLTKRRPDLQAFIGMEQHDGFKRYLELITRREHVQWTPQHRFIYDEGGELMVDYVGCFERLVGDAGNVLSRLGIQGPLSRWQATERLPMDVYYDREAIEMVAEMYATDVQIFGYSGCAPNFAS